MYEEPKFFTHCWPSFSLWAGCRDCAVEVSLTRGSFSVQRTASQIKVRGRFREFYKRNVQYILYSDRLGTENNSECESSLGQHQTKLIRVFYFRFDRGAHHFWEGQPGEIYSSEVPRPDARAGEKKTRRWLQSGWQRGGGAISSSNGHSSPNPGSFSDARKVN